VEFGETPNTAPETGALAKTGLARVVRRRFREGFYKATSESVYRVQQNGTNLQTLLIMRNPADLEVGDTAGWEACAANASHVCINAGVNYPGQNWRNLDWDLSALFTLVRRGIVPASIGDGPGPTPGHGPQQAPFTFRRIPGGPLNSYRPPIR
jgi:hypothetical protein